MKLFIIGIAFAYNPFEIKNEIPDCLDQCGGVGGKCEEICGPSKLTFSSRLIHSDLIIQTVIGGYCCAPGNDFGDCSEMIRYGMSLIDPNIDTNEFKCVHYRNPVSKTDH